MSMIDLHTAALVARLALLFREEVRDAVAPRALVEIDRKNYAADDPAGVCASHDYCDSNQCMINAWGALMPNDEINPASEQDITIVNAAWNAVKAHGFSDCAE
jgi:hypothetical protein